jgi:hypothetical protein
MPSGIPAHLRQTITARMEAQPRVPGIVAIHPETNGAAVLARVLSEPTPTRRMSAAELRAALEEIGIGTGRLARLLGYSDRMGRHLVLGDRPLPVAAEIVIRLLATHRVSIGCVERLMDAPYRS